MAEEHYFGIALRQIRRQKKLTQEELAEICNFDRSAIGYWENGKRMPKLDTLFRIAKGLGISPEQIITLTIKLYRDDTYS